MSRCARSSSGGRRSAASTARPTTPFGPGWPRPAAPSSAAAGCTSPRSRRSASRRRPARPSWWPRPRSWSTSTSWGPTTARFRDLMTEWKAAGGAPKGAEAELWGRFRAAQDAFFAARTASRAERDAGLKAAFEAREALLVEAEALDPKSDVVGARKRLRDIQRRWDALEAVPRDSAAALERRLAAVEERVRGRSSRPASARSLRQPAGDPAERVDREARAPDRPRRKGRRYASWPPRPVPPSKPSAAGWRRRPRGSLAHRRGNAEAQTTTRRISSIEVSPCKHLGQAVVAQCRHAGGAGACAPMASADDRETASRSISSSTGMHLVQGQPTLVAGLGAGRATDGPKERRQLVVLPWPA